MGFFKHHSTGSSSCYAGQTQFLPWDWAYDWHHYGLIISGFCASFAIVLSVYQIWRHFQNYNNPPIQRYICRILLMVPIYASDSWLSFRWYRHAVYFDVLRDCYEAFVIYNFFILLLQFLGGFDKAKKLFITKVVKLPAPLCFIKVLSQGRGTFLMLCKNGAVQYVALRPITTLVAFTTHIFDVYCPGSTSPKHAYFYTCLTNFLSVTVAMYVLVTLYLACHDELMPHKPVPKFLCIKFVIFFSFWQSVCIYLLTQMDVIKETPFASAEDVGTMINSLLVCIEMFMAALMHGKAFSWKDFATKEGTKTSTWVSLKHTISIRDLLVDLKLPVPKRKPRLMRLPDGTFMLTYASGAHAFDTGSDDEGDEDQVYTKSLVDHERMRIDEKMARQMVAAKQIRRTGSSGLPVPEAPANGHGADAGAGAGAPGGAGVALPGGRREVRPADAPPPVEVEEVDFSDIKLPPLAPLFRPQPGQQPPKSPRGHPHGPKGPPGHAPSHPPKSPRGGPAPAPALALGGGPGRPLLPPPRAAAPAPAPASPARAAAAAGLAEEDEFGDFAAAEAAAPETPTRPPPPPVPRSASAHSVPRSSSNTSVGRTGSGGGEPATPHRGSFSAHPVVQGADGDLGGEVEEGDEPAI